eukprot:TRINITY_DN7568_c0_g2_i1.p3 TRINITY_DN7568_c0_g2~~TRINITY_DN7568_c0_g2_i1.p3  ORF type:complete len:115 (-),score=26.97 TRINITY_DN7568_c0_g2_i1:206-550(-)
MSPQDIKQLKIKTGALKRYGKELSYYEKEVEGERAKVEGLKAKGIDAHDLNQAENVLKESEMMIPVSKKNLENAIKEVKELLKAEMEECEELLAAQSAMTEAEQILAKYLPSVA